MVSTVSGIKRAIAVFYRKQDVRGGFSVDDRSGISMLAPDPGDSRIEIIRGGEEELVRLNQQPEEKSVEKPTPAVNVNTSSASVDAAIKQRH